VVAPVLKGGQGAGKGIIVQMLGDIVGQEHFISATRLEAVTGTFQEEKVKTNLLTFLDECTFGGDKRQASILKGLLSESERKWEAKYLNPIRIKNHSNFIVASNYDKIVLVEQDDRRWFCLEIDSKYSGGNQTDEIKSYFDALGAVDSRAFAYMLYNRDISGFNPRSIPSTAYGRAQKSINLDSPNAWIEHILQEGMIQNKTIFTQNYGLSGAQDNRVSKEDVIVAYQDFTRLPGQGYNNAVGDRQLLKKLRDVVGVTTGKIGPRGHQKSCVTFPCLEDARDNFTKAMRETEWEWDS
jgi:hypothetical protein